MIPCSSAHRKGCNPWHARLVGEYRDARDAWEQAFEVGTASTYRLGIIGEARRATRRGGRNEVVDFVDSSPPVVFRDWLIAHRREEPPT